uniref:Uncharacterized protein n=1 Tax=Oryza sativa subsp. japonica TaxID=39947 RepID=Q75J35_ORYSJ|nr:hypothetical protein [Oryza sativa Japonica Group]
MDNMPLHKIAKDKIPLNILSSLYFATLSRFKTKIPPNVKRGRERGATAAVLVACGQRACGDGWREGKEDGAAQGGRTAPPGGRGEGQRRRPREEGANRGEEDGTADRRLLLTASSSSSGIHGGGGGGVRAAGLEAGWDRELEEHSSKWIEQQAEPHAATSATILERVLPSRWCANGRTFPPATSTAAVAPLSLPLSPRWGYFGLKTL